MSRVKLMLVGEHKLFRECLASMLGEVERYSVLQQVDDLGAALLGIRKRPPDVVLVDLGAPTDATLRRMSEVAGSLPGVKLVVLGLPEVEADIVRCLEAGASGYVLKESSLDELTTAIDLAVKGEAACSPHIARSLFSRLAELAQEQRRCERFAALDLTGREVEILELIAESLSNKQIADRLCLSVYTVKNHVHNILEKLQVHRREEAVKKAYRKRWLRERERWASGRA